MVEIRRLVAGCSFGRFWSFFAGKDGKRVSTVLVRVHESIFPKITRCLFFLFLSQTSSKKVFIKYKKDQFNE